MVLQTSVHTWLTTSGALDQKSLSAPLAGRQISWWHRSARSWMWPEERTPVLKTLLFTETSPSGRQTTAMELSLAIHRARKWRRLRRRQMRADGRRRAEIDEEREASKRYVLAKILPPLSRRLLSGSRSLRLLLEMSTMRTRNSVGPDDPRRREALSGAAGRGAHDRRCCPANGRGRPGPARPASQGS